MKVEQIDFLNQYLVGEKLRSEEVSETLQFVVALEFGLFTTSLELACDHGITLLEFT